VDTLEAPQQAAPDWSQIDAEICCPRCGYNLRMLERPRCPECGLSYDWADILEEARWQSDFLFEHQWRKRPLRSYLATILLSLRPTRFWTRVSLHTRPHPRPIWLVFLSVQAWFLLVMYAIVYASTALATWSLRQWIPGRGYPPLAHELFLISNNVARFLDDYGVRVQPLLALWAALIVLVCLRQTLARCRVRGVHMLRIVAYSAAPLLFFWTLLTLMVGLAGGFTIKGARFQGQSALLAALLGCVVSLGIFISVGARRYARLPRPWLVGMVTAALSVLFGFTAVMLWRVGY